MNDAVKPCTCMGTPSCGDGGFEARLRRNCPQHGDNSQNTVTLLNRVVAAARVRELMELPNDYDVSKYLSAALAEYPYLTHTHQLVWGGCVWACLEHNVDSKDIYLRQWNNVKNNRAPTPREQELEAVLKGTQAIYREADQQRNNAVSRAQELEAQNKALLELVRAAKLVVSKMEITIKYVEQQGIPNGGIPPSMVALQNSLATIQKEKKRKNK
ncbi:hypothetical protein EBT16_05615 [bacterium]|nr:hypothetical protein [bacterium]